MSSIITCTCTVKLNRFYADVTKNNYCASLLINQKANNCIPSNYNLILRFKSLNDIVSFLDSLLKAGNLATYNELSEANLEATLSLIAKYCYEQFYSLDFKNVLKLDANSHGGYFAATNDF